MSHSQFHSISSLYLDMHGLIFERLFHVGYMYSQHPMDSQSSLAQSSHRLSLDRARLYLKPQHKHLLRPTDI